MVSGFKQYLKEESSTAFFTFGRMNPPTIGHGKLLDALDKNSGGEPYFIFLSQSQDAKQNPLAYTDKVRHVRKMFPKHSRRVMLDKKVKTVFDAATFLYNKGYKNITMVVGSDRVNEFNTLLNKYNGVKGRHGFYNFKKIDIVSAGARDPDAKGVEGMSASKQRENAANNDFSSFSQGLPKQTANKDARRLFNDVRLGMGLKEESNFKRHIELPPISEERENYVKGKLFDLGDKVQIKGTQQIGEVTWLGSNYLVVNVEGTNTRKWLTDVELLDEDKTKVAQDSDIAKRKGSQPKKYHQGLSKTTKIKRDRQFKKQSKMADDNPNAYKPAPGDKTAETKPSKYTKAFKNMYGEQMDPISRAKEKIKRERETDKAKHDRIMDRARLRATKLKNREPNK